MERLEIALQPEVRNFGNKSNQLSHKGEKQIKQSWNSHQQQADQDESHKGHRIIKYRQQHQTISPKP